MIPDISSKVAPKRPRLVRIGPEDSQFFVHSFVADAQQFIKLFRGAVAQIPAGVCDVLSAYWTPNGPTSPKIVLGEHPVISTTDGRSAGIGMSELNGRVIWFAGPAIKVIPEALGRCLIAHELAHAHTDAELHMGVLGPTERISYERAESNQPELIRLREEYADARLMCWGFDAAGLRMWTSDYLRQFGLQ